MHGLRFWVSVQLALIVALAGGLMVGLALPGWAQEERELSLVNGQSLLEQPEDQMTNDQGQMTNAPIPQLSELEQPATTIEDWMAQIEASLVQITNVRVEAIENGLRVILETTDGSLDAPETRSVGNALIADIPNATLVEEFSQADPIEGIALVSVSQLPDSRVRVAITGTDAPPMVEVTTEAQGLVLAVILGDADAVAEEDAIQVVVTGEQDEGYNPSNASTATRTDTPLRDIPASITVVPRQVLEDRNVRDLSEALETVSGVTGSFNAAGVSTGGRYIRGFSQFGSLRNGLSQGTQFNFYSLDSIGTVEQIEVLKGPASILFGAVEPGGVVNVITRQPLSEPYYNLEFEAGSGTSISPLLISQVL